MWHGSRPKGTKGLLKVTNVWVMSGLDHTLPTNTIYSPLDLGHPGVGNRRENENGSIECRRICEIKSSEYMS